MNDAIEYELIDFGDGRKLESIGGYWIDRPSPAAIDYSRREPTAWRDASAKFDSHTNRWDFRKPWPADCYLRGESFRLPLRPTPFGHIGAFPEQRSNWKWLSEYIAGTTQAVFPRKPQTMNLFAHTGGSTFAMAGAGAEVVHVDAAKPNVVAAKYAAEVSGMSAAKIRYMVDDAMKFTAREARRFRVYDLVVLDPPAYGHAPDGKAWRIERDLWLLIDQVMSLLDNGRGGILITGHTATIDEAMVIEYLEKHLLIRGGNASVRFDAGRSQLPDRFGRKLDAGFYIRATWAA